jgi:hypothetical protein
MRIAMSGHVIEFNWPVQKQDFEPDGSLRDIYVVGTTADDWNKFVRHIASGPYRAKFTMNGAPRPIPPIVDELFGTAQGLLTFWVGTVALACHFFAVEEIELDFIPNGVGERELRLLLTFIADIGDLTGKVVVLTPENCREEPIFRYSPSTAKVEWIAPAPK